MHQSHVLDLLTSLQLPLLINLPKSTLLLKGEKKKKERKKILAYQVISRTWQHYSLNHFLGKFSAVFMSLYSF